MTSPRLVLVGDSTLVAEFEPCISIDANARAVALAAHVSRQALAGVRDIVPTFRTVAVHFDPLATDLPRLAEHIRTACSIVAEAKTLPPTVVEVPVCYDADFGPDLEEVARFAGVSRERVVATHAGAEYRVFMLGFLPGFAYLGLVDAHIAAPRRKTPRLQVPAGSVAIAGQQTGIYPVQSPGGWNIIGRTPMRVLSLGSMPPCLLKAGDSVRFTPIDRATYERLAANERPAA